MKTDKNKHGLKRRIRDPIKRVIRQECGNGCVICGRIPYEYDHFDPPFDEALAHDPKGIALLCLEHHGEKTAGRLNPAEVAARRRNPYNKERDAVWKVPLGTEGWPTFVIGTNTFEKCPRAGVRVNGEPLWALRRDEENQWLLSGAFCDEDGRDALKIVDNETVFHRGSWDVELAGTELIIRTAPHRIALHLTFDGNRDLVALKRLSMTTATGLRFEVDSASFRWGTEGGLSYLAMANCKSVGSVGYIQLNHRGGGVWKDWVASPLPLGTFRQRETQRRAQLKQRRKR
jgi:hypothetical protein